MTDETSSRPAFVNPSYRGVASYARTLTRTRSRVLGPSTETSHRMPSTSSSGSGRGNGATSVAINGKAAEERGSEVKNGQTASERVIGVEMRFVPLMSYDL